MMKLCAYTIFVIYLVSILRSTTQEQTDENYLLKLLAKPKCVNAVTEEPTLPQLCGQNSKKENSFMQLVEQLLQRQCNLVDVSREQEKEIALIDGQEVDFIVVGAGTAGSVVAGRLAQTTHYWEVAVLEAGGSYPTATMVPSNFALYSKPGSPVNWNFELEDQKYACLGHQNGRCSYTRGKVLGGTAAINDMTYIRGNRYDYDKWAEEGNNSWSYDKLLPYFKLSEKNLQIGEEYTEQFHGKMGLMPVTQFRAVPILAYKMLEAVEEMGIDVVSDLNSKEQLGFAIAQANTFNGSRVSTYNAYIEPIIGEKNLFISTNSYVTKVLLDHKCKAMGVEYVKNNKRFTLFARKEVILSTGPIKSPQILMLSGLGPEKHLKKFHIRAAKNLEMVGENLQNHVGFNMRFNIINKCLDEPLNKYSLYEYVMKREGSLASSGLSQFTGFLHSNSNKKIPKNVPDVQILSSGFLADCSENGNVEHGSKCNHSPDITITPVLLHPNSVGSVKLRSADPFEAPLIYANYLNDEEDVHTLLDAIKFVQDMSQTSALRDVIKLSGKPVMYCENEFGTERYWGCAIRYWTSPQNNQVGTCSMGISQEDSVVDTFLRVHGTEGLRVIDSSVIPHTISGGGNAPVMALAERGVDMIIKWWSSQ